MRNLHDLDLVWILSVSFIYFFYVLGRHIFAKNVQNPENYSIRIDTYYILIHILIHRNLLLSLFSCRNRRGKRLQWTALEAKISSHSDERSDALSSPEGISSEKREPSIFFLLHTQKWHGPFMETHLWI